MSALAPDAALAVGDCALAVPVAAVFTEVPVVPALVAVAAVVPAATLAVDIVEEADAVDAAEDVDTLLVTERAADTVSTPVADDTGADVAVLVAIAAPEDVEAFDALLAPLHEVRSRTSQSSALGPSGRGRCGIVRIIP